MNVRIDRRRAALMVIDVQEKLAAVMPDEPLGLLEANVAVLAEAARRFELPVVVTEQYPKGLGRTTQNVLESLAQLGPLVHRLEKIEFSACACDEFLPVWNDVEREQWILTGMECHICVYQTARQLLERGAEVQVVRDAVCARFHRNWEVGLGLMEKAGVVITSTEAVVFDLLGKAGTEDFKALSRMIR